MVTARLICNKGFIHHRQVFYVLSNMEASKQLFNFISVHSSAFDQAENEWMIQLTSPLHTTIYKKINGKWKEISSYDN